MTVNLQQNLKTTIDLKKIEIYIHKIINSNNNINVYRTFNNVIVHKTQNKLPEPKYLATKIA